MTEEENSEIKKRKVSDFATYENNPFIPNHRQLVAAFKLHVYQRQVRHTEGDLVDKNSGEVSSVVITKGGGYGVVDRGEFSKLYAAGRDAVADLNPIGVKMLCYVLKVLSKDADRVYLSPDGFLGYVNLKSRKSYYDGVFDLLDKGFLGRCIREHDYYINPSMIFNGQRTNIPQVKKDINYLIRLNKGVLNDKKDNGKGSK